MASATPSALRWRILRRALLGTIDDEVDEESTKISRVPMGNFGLIAFCPVNSNDENFHDSLLWEYELSKETKLLLWQKTRNGLSLKECESCWKSRIDSTGTICLWPAEEVLAFFCISHPALFRNKKVVELGSGYGLAGLAVAVVSDASEVVLTDGNSDVVSYLQHNILFNSHAYGDTKVSASLLYWSKEEVLNSKCDLIIAADCTYFKNFHEDLAYTIKGLLRTSKESEAILFCPSRGNSLEAFVQVARTLSLDTTVIEQYDQHIWERHQELMSSKCSSWQNYDKDHCYPLLVSVKLNLAVCTNK